MIVNPSFANYRFIFYKLLYHRGSIIRLANGAAQQNLNVGIISNYKIKCPFLPEQKVIAATLSCLDDMIELNNRNNQVLEEMAQAIFKHWFVDFEFPNQDGQPYKSSGGAMADSELGKIPEGWRVGVLGNVLTLNYGKALPAKKRINGQIRVYSSAGITGFHNQALVNEPSIIVGRKGTIGTVYYSTEPSFCIDTAYYATQKDSQYPLLLMYQILKELKLNQYNEDSAVPGLNRNTVYDIRIIIPPDAILNQYNEILISIYSLIFDNTLRNQTLTATRDTLLPKLMSGEIRVPVEEVV